MKGVLVRDFTHLSDAVYADVDDPVAGPGEVIVAVAATEASHADLLLIEGKYQFKPPLPFTPGTSGTGRVISAGPGVSKPCIGDRVIFYTGHGAFAEKAKVIADHCFAIPDSVDLVVAAGLGLSFQTAYLALQERARLQPGKSVLVLGGTGSVGTATMLLAKALGAGTVLGTTRSPDLAKAFSADGEDLIDLTSCGSGDGLRDRVRDLTGGKGVDIVIDLVGGEVGQGALRCLNWDGVQVVVGFASGAIPLIKANYLLLKNISATGLQWTDYLHRRPGLVGQVQESTFALHMGGLLQAATVRHEPLAAFATCLEDIRHRRVTGQTVLVMP